MLIALSKNRRRRRPRKKRLISSLSIWALVNLAFAEPTDSDNGSSTKTASMDSTTDTASGFAIVMKDKKNHGMKNKYKRIFNKPSNITHTRTYYGINKIIILKKCMFGMMLK